MNTLMEKEEVGHGGNKLSDRRQVVALVVLLLVVAVTFGLSIARLYSEIRHPFQTKSTKVNPNESFLSKIQSSDENKESLKMLDSDSDGLSDYDELYVYHTSPYLKDTDSDGSDDKTEIGKGSDPNCPDGKVCSPQLPSPIQAENTASSQTPNTQSEVTAQDMANIDKLTPVQVRDLLRKQGVPEQALQALDDKTLLQKFKESVGKAASEQAQRDNTLPPIQTQGQAGVSSTQQPIDPATLSVTQIRDLLKKQPNVTDAQKKQLDKLSDEQVKKIFLDAYQRTSTKQK